MEKSPVYPKSSDFGISRRKFISSCSACAAFCAATPIIGLSHSKTFEANEKKQSVLFIHCILQNKTNQIGQTLGLILIRL